MSLLCGHGLQCCVLMQASQQPLPKMHACSYKHSMNPCCSQHHVVTALPVERRGKKSLTFSSSIKMARPVVLM